MKNFYVFSDIFVGKFLKNLNIIKKKIILLYLSVKKKN